VKKHGFSVKEDGPPKALIPIMKTWMRNWLAYTIYLKFVKYGFGRATDHACIELPQQAPHPGRAKKLVLRYDGKYPNYAVSEFIKYSALPKRAVDEVIDSYTNPILFKTDEDGEICKRCLG
jgi:hypothetical protein